MSIPWVGAQRLEWKGPFGTRRTATFVSGLHVGESPEASSAPQCRAGWTRHLLNGTKALPRPIAARVQAAIDPAALERLSGAVAIHWLPLGVHMSVLYALRATLGPRAYVQFCAARIRASLDIPALFAKPARAALRLYGAEPFALFRAINPSLPYIIRNAGRVRVVFSSDRRELDIFYEDCPPSFAAGDTWALTWAGAFEALTGFGLAGGCAPPEIELTGQDAERGRFSWHARLPRSG